MAKITLRRLPSKAEMDRIVTGALKATAIEATKIIKLRTARGVDVNGGGFRPYSAQYAKAKGGSGRDVSHVDLTVTGAMLNDLKLLRVASPTKAVIGFEGQHRSYSFTKGGRRLKDGSRTSYQLKVSSKTVSYLDLVGGIERFRKFFGITRDDEIHRLASVFEQELTKGLQKLQ